MNFLIKWATLGQGSGLSFPSSYAAFKLRELVIIKVIYSSLIFNSLSHNHTYLSHLEENLKMMLVSKWWLSCFWILEDQWRNSCTFRVLFLCFHCLWVSLFLLCCILFDRFIGETYNKYSCVLHQLSFQSGEYLFKVY